MRSSILRLHVFGMVLVAVVIVSCTKQPASTGGTAAATSTMTEKELPWQKFYFLADGDEITLSLPSGKKILFRAKKDEFGSAEQTTACGLKAHVQEPDFDQLKNYGVTTSGNYHISVYSFDLDGYRVDRAEDLAAKAGLPVVIRVCKAAGAAEIDSNQLRRVFDANVPFSRPALRVPITTVHHELNQQFNVPIRLVSIDGKVSFEISGLTDVAEDVRLSTVSAIEQYVVDHYDDVDRIADFSIVILKDETPMARYVASKNGMGVWTLKKLP